MIPLLIRWTLGCNYQSWWEEDEGDEVGNGGQELFLSLSLSLVLALSFSLPFLQFVSQRRRGIDSY